MQMSFQEAFLGLYLLQQLAAEGHCYYPSESLCEKTAEMLGVSQEAVKEQLPALAIDQKITIKNGAEGGRVYMRSYYQVLRRCTLRDGKGLEHLTISRSYTSYADLERALLNCMELYFEERERTAGLQYSEYVLRAQQFIRREYIPEIVKVASIRDYLYDGAMYYIENRKDQ